MRRAALDQGMDLDNGQEVLLQHEDRHAVQRYKFRREDFSGKKRRSRNADSDAAEEKHGGQLSRRMQHRMDHCKNHGFPWTAAVGDSAGLGMTGINVPTVRVSSFRY